VCIFCGAAVFLRVPSSAMASSTRHERYAPPHPPPRRKGSTTCHNAESRWRVLQRVSFLSGIAVGERRKVWIRPAAAASSGVRCCATSGRIKRSMLAALCFLCSFVPAQLHAGSSIQLDKRWAPISLVMRGGQASNQSPHELKDERPRQGHIPEQGRQQQGLFPPGHLSAHGDAGPGASHVPRGGQAHDFSCQNVGGDVL
jgi:hypothetical protein